MLKDLKKLHEHEHLLNLGGQYMGVIYLFIFVYWKHFIKNENYKRKDKRELIHQRTLT